MKKFLACLLVFVFVVAGIFADATSTGAAALRITTCINATEPTFKLSTAQLESNLATAANSAAVDAITATALAGEDSHEITEDLLLSAAQTVDFVVTQVTASRSVKTYTLSATATDLVLYKYKNPAGEDVLVSATPHPATDAEKKFVVGATTVNTFANGDLEAAKATYGGTTSAKTITYKGTTVPANVDVATFTCTWGANADAVTGEYQATVTLTITST